MRRITQRDAWEHYGVILEQVIEIAGPIEQMTEKHVARILHAYANLLTYTREAEREKPYAEVPYMEGAHLRFKECVRGIALIVEEEYHEVEKITGLAANVL